MVTSVFDCHRCFRRTHHHEGPLLPDGSGVSSTHMAREPNAQLHFLVEDLKKVFIDNFQSSRHRVATRHDFSLCKQEHNEGLRSYMRHFFASIANISDENVIDWFDNDVASQNQYDDFGRNRPSMVV